MLRLIPDVIAFGIGLGTAYYLKWETSDLVWSLWLCSLTLGYTTLLSTLTGHAIVGLPFIWRDNKRGERALPILGFALFSSFLLAFFSFHFLGFHWIHAIFLEGFFPIDGVPQNSFDHPILFARTCIFLIKPYGLALIPVLIAERKHVFHGLLSTLSAHRGGERYHGPCGDKIGQTMGMAYVNVVRMHLLIFVFALSESFKIDSFTIYAIVYATYFFPWSEVKQLRRSNTKLDPIVGSR
jgi:hypothetical protein